ncbi:pyridoxamine 5'-phosphate oxidase family protein [Streptomyces kaniharaensis]|uniref:Pyridoxamine 5'-phosphate oxidase family protein n=1 Tax=Streptomyces kaniharaensis TaxID=212423 RepID=A0A6N7L3X7_9ACTN|nr:pyridoxamine 5'-phosphate oxidase family protein [Streptomyces kaniharaensis]MQS16894.1 pyridoxamine 5'-phosphate oxidase family protein [Streptomyces kaniharaensis]
MNDTPAAEPDPAAAARRITERREKLGLTEAELAARAAMAPSYLRFLLEAGPGFDQGGFVRIAAVLGVSRAELVEGRADAPPGQGGAGPRPRLLNLTEEECWGLVGTHGVGRIGLPVRPGPVVYPVNYVVDARAIAYRTAERSSTDPPEGAAVSFQIDRIDEYLGRGWSVLVLGTAQHVGDPDEIRHLAGLPGASPWAGGDRPLWVRVRPDAISGRRIVSG